jgi:hypothetical protein
VFHAKTFHQPIGTVINKLEMHFASNYGGYRETPKTWNAPVTNGHMFDVDVPAFPPVDTTKFPSDGWYGIKLDLTLGTPADDNTGLPKGGHLVRFQFPVYVENGKPMHTAVPGLIAGGAGNVDEDIVPPPGTPDFRQGYIDVELHALSLPDFLNGRTFNPGQPVTYKGGMSIGSKAAGKHALITRNPDMHTHPPTLGAVLYGPNKPFSAKQYASATLPADYKGSDKLFLRTASNNPAMLGNASAAVLVLREVPAP